MANSEQLLTKAEVLCWGLQPSHSADEVRKLQHPTSHRRTGNSGLHLITEDSLVINAIYGDPFCRTSPYHLEQSDHGLFLIKKDTYVTRVEATPAPKWYTRRTSSGIPMSDIFLQEGRDTLITAIWNDCAYFKIGQECLFCANKPDGNIVRKTERDITETVEAALNENPAYHVHLTGGNTLTSDHGIAGYEQYVKALRTLGESFSISLEVSPPDDVSVIDRLVEAGITGLSINIEAWDENIREMLCPGKSQIGREKYINAWDRGVDLLGAFKVSSVLIVMPEHIRRKATYEYAVMDMIRQGIKPTLIPLRPFQESRINYLQPPTPKTLLDLSLFAGRVLRENGATCNMFQGCEHCGACSLEGDII